MGEGGGRIQKIAWLAAGLALLAGCGGGEQRPALQTGPEQTIEHFTVAETRRGEPVWELEAEEAEVFGEGKPTQVRAPRVRFFTNARPGSILTARTGLVDSRTSDMEAHGEVKVVSLLEGTTLYTDHLRWVAGRERIVSDAPVRQERRDRTITGVGFEATSDLHEVMIASHVVVTMKPAPRKAR